MEQHERQALIDAARQVLEANWLGASTKPAARLYPHQWSWDAAFIAIGYAHYDQERAERELRSLFAGQWRNGLLPHIVFNPQASAYFPGPEFWSTEGSPYAPAQPRTSGIVQPPVHATAVLQIYRHAQDRRQAQVFLAEMFPRLLAWHDYLYRERDVRGHGLAAIFHPWESGTDNSPLWDAALQRMVLRAEDVPQYRRVDTTIIAAEERPTNAEYDRYAYLVKLFADRRYDDAAIRRDCPFQVEDVLFNTLLCRAGHDLAEIARVIDEDPAPAEQRAKQTAAALNERLWSEEQGAYLDFDLAAGEPIQALVAGCFAPLYAGIPTPERAERMYRRLNSPSFCGLDQGCFPVPTYDRQASGYSPARYWRGPVWINLNWLLYHGLRRYGYDDYARRVREAIIELPRRSGFYEYFSPETGQGHGADTFSWTAALLLDLLYTEE